MSDLLFIIDKKGTQVMNFRRPDLVATIICFVFIPLICGLFEKFSTSLLNLFFVGLTPPQMEVGWQIRLVVMLIAITITWPLFSKYTKIVIPLTLSLICGTTLIFYISQQTEGGYSLYVGLWGLDSYPKLFTIGFWYLSVICLTTLCLERYGDITLTILVVAAIMEEVYFLAYSWYHLNIFRQIAYDLLMGLVHPTLIASILAFFIEFSFYLYREIRPPRFI